MLLVLLQHQYFPDLTAVYSIGRLDQVSQFKGNDYLFE
jgi:hypothetical protein